MNTLVNHQLIYLIIIKFISNCYEYGFSLSEFLLTSELTRMIKIAKKYVPYPGKCDKIGKSEVKP